MKERDWEREGFELVLIGLFLAFGIPLYNSASEWSKTIVLFICVFGGIIMVLVGWRKGKKKNKSKDEL